MRARFPGCFHLSENITTFIRIAFKRRPDLLILEISMSFDLVNRSYLDSEKRLTHGGFWYMRNSLYRCSLPATPRDAGFV